MVDIFISYASENRDKAIPIAKSLEEQGWSVWWDRTILPGKSFDEVIEEAISAAKCVVVLWSKKSIKSNWVKEEADRGKKRQILVPARIDPVEPPIGFGLIQAADLTNWKGELNHEGFKLLIGALTGLLGPAKVQAPVPEPPKTEIRKQIPAEAPIEKAKTAAAEPSEPKADRTGPSRKSPASKIRVLIALAVVIVSGAIWLFRPETPKPRTDSLPPQIKPEVQQKTPERKVATKPSETSPQKIITNSIGMKFVLIPAGSFTMGSWMSTKELMDRFGGVEESYKWEKPYHIVKIKRSFYLQTTPVTQGQWQRVMGNHPSKFNDKGDDCPVEQVSWEDAQRFIGKLNSLEETKVYLLPTEAEWEYACRAGSGTEFSFGNDPEWLGEFAWFKSNSGASTHPVGEKEPNSWGLYDMHGNVWEWLEDDWHGSYNGAPDDGSAWIDEPRGSYRVIRGGCWHDDARFCRSATRLSGWPGDRTFDVGFRLSRSVALGP